MGVVELELDDDTLFHALAIHEHDKGAWALRAEIMHFLHYQAAAGRHDEWAQHWLHEAGQLQDFDGRYYYGTEISAMGYSALRGVKVLVHTRQAQGPCQVHDASHPRVPPGAPSVHVLHYGRGRYDGLIEITNAQNLDGLQPAWDQPVASAAFASLAAQYPNAANEDSSIPDVPYESPWVSSYRAWLYELVHKKQGVPGYIIYLLTTFISLVLYGTSPASFCAEIQGILQRRLQDSTSPPNWLRYLLYEHRFTQ